MTINKINPYQNIIAINQTNKNTSVKFDLSSNNKKNPINQIPNIYYKPITFGRSYKEHKSWGAVISPDTKDVSFKILTYPDTKKVTVTIIKNNGKTKKEYELENKGNGIFETKNKIPKEEASHGDRYFYTLYKGNGDIDRVKDPYSFRQFKLLDESVLYDHSLYKWNDDNWYKNNKNRISRKADNTNQLTPVNAARIYELNIASLSRKGTFESAKNVIKQLPTIGFNTIEIMPVENTYSFNWGYDGVDKFAPSEHLGGPDGLKKLIDYAHNIGLNVIMDMVPNHLGPDGASLLRTGPYIGGNNCFGESFNFEGENSQYVRDYIVNAALNWIDNYHCDGLRLDMTKFMNSDYTMKQIAAELNYHKPDAFLIAEDARTSVSIDDWGNYWTNYDELHDKRVINPLLASESGEGENETIHINAINKISESDTSLGRIGFNSEWDFNYYHQLNDALYGSVNLDDFEKALYCSQDRVKYIMSHDEIGNFEGTRLIAKLLVPMLHLNDNIMLNPIDDLRAKELSENKNISFEDAKRTVMLQKAQFTAEKLAILLLTGELDKYSTEDITSRKWKKVVNDAFDTEILKPLGIKNYSRISYEQIKKMYEKSYSKVKMAMARTFATPGPKMVFQGDEKADLTPFRFFREFQSVKDEHYLYVEKGYKTDKSALNDSKQGAIKYSPKGRMYINRFKKLIEDLNQINRENPALSKGYIVPDKTVKHPFSQVISTLACDNESGNQIYTITNFRDTKYPETNGYGYYITFPKGKWIEILNTDDKKYSGSGNTNNNIIESNGNQNIPVNISGNSTIIFKKID